MLSNVIEQFRSALTRRSIIPPAHIQADGQLHRCDAEGKHGKKDAAYVLHLDGLPAGGFENHCDGQGWENWHAVLPERSLSSEELPQKRPRIAPEWRPLHSNGKPIRKIVNSMPNPPRKHDGRKAKRVCQNTLI